MQSSEFRASINKFPINTGSPLAEWSRIAAISSIFDANGIGCKPCQEEVPHIHIITADLGTLCRRMSWFGELFLSLLLPFLLVNPYFDPAILLSTWPENILSLHIWRPLDFSKSVLRIEPHKCRHLESSASRDYEFLFHFTLVCLFFWRGLLNNSQHSNWSILCGWS